MICRDNVCCFCWQLQRDVSFTFAYNMFNISFVPSIPFVRPVRSYYKILLLLLFRLCARCVICSIVAYDMKYIANVLLFDCSHVPAHHVVADAAAVAAFQLTTIRWAVTWAISAPSADKTQSRVCECVFLCICARRLQLHETQWKHISR